MTNEIYALILAAGKGTRMKSERNKVLHPVGGLPMVEQVIRQLQSISVEKIAVIVGHQQEQVRETLADRVHFIEQTQQLGTGHAVMAARSWLVGKQGLTLVLCGDTPLLTKETLQRLIDTHKQGAAGTIITAIADDPTGYGRIIRDDAGNVVRIVEQKDGSPDELEIQEVNSGIYCFDNEALFRALENITDNNAQGEYYLTDVIGIFADQGETILPCIASSFDEIVGINDRVALAHANRILQTRIREHWMRQGVTMLDPESTYIDSLVQLGKDITLYPGTHLRGETVIADGCVIGPNVEIENSIVEKETTIRQSVIVDSTIGQAVNVGPFAYIRPGSKIGNHVKIGDFVEIKNSSIDEHSKVSHLSYIGDAELGKSVNIGCGTVTVNYDGKKKHKTTIKDHAFIGCNVNLIAPVTVGEAGFVAAGSTISQDVPEQALAIARSKQVNKLNYARKF